MRRRLITLPVTLLLLTLVFSGCFTVKYTIPSERPRSSYDVAGSFEVKKRASWVIFGLVPISEGQVEEIVATEVKRLEGDAATNVTVMAQYDAVDVIVGVVVGGLFNTRSYTVTGDVVRFNNGTAAQSAPPADDIAESKIIGEITYK